MYDLSSSWNTHGLTRRQLTFASGDAFSVGCRLCRNQHWSCEEAVAYRFYGLVINNVSNSTEKMPGHKIKHIQDGRSDESAEEQHTCGA